MANMQTIYETRLARLAMLVKEHDDKLANLNEKLGFDRTDSTLSQLRTKARHSKTGKTRGMGDGLARKIENKLSLGLGWMDTPPTYAELNGEQDPIAQVQFIMESMPPGDRPTAVRLVAAFAQPKAINGNGNDH